MTLQEALKYDNLLKHNLMEKAATLNLSEETASQIMDQHVLVIQDDARSGMIFLGNKPEKRRCSRPGTICCG